MVSAHTPSTIHMAHLDGKGAPRQSGNTPTFGLYYTPASPHLQMTPAQHGLSQAKRALVLLLRNTKEYDTSAAARKTFQEITTLLYAQILDSNASCW